MRFHVDMMPRILARVIVADDGCWVWQSTKKDGYGMAVVGYSVDPRRPVKRPAHRVAYEASIGPVPPGLDLDHLCRNRACCNPAHLEPVTRRENVLRGMLPAMMRDKAAAQTHCYKGHPLSGDNLQLQGPNKKFRVCRTCRAHRRRIAYQQEKRTNGTEAIHQ